jgi:hypothetical protein
MEEDQEERRVRSTSPFEPRLLTRYRLKSPVLCHKIYLNLNLSALQTPSVEKPAHFHGSPSHQLEPRKLLLSVGQLERALQEVRKCVIQDLHSVKPDVGDRRS